MKTFEKISHSLLVGHIGQHVSTVETLPLFHRLFYSFSFDMRMPWPKHGFEQLAAFHITMQHEMPLETKYRTATLSKVDFIHF